MLNSKFIEALKNLGVEEVVSCPGGRSADLLNQLIKSKEFKIESFYDERSAGFYALGRSIETEKPVAVLTTSGSAAANVYPSLLESKYAENGKLILISADRPSEFGKTGAPQTISQNDMFAVNGIETLTVNDFDKEFSFYNITYPLHINLHSKDPNPLRIRPVEIICDSLVVIASLKKGEADEVKKFLQNYEGALILESLSNLKESDFPKATILKYADNFLNKIRLAAFKDVYRVGGVPLIKSWREAHLHSSVFYWNEYNLPGTIGATSISLEEIAKNTSGTKVNDHLKEKINEYAAAVEILLEEFKTSEVSRFRAVTKLIPSGSKVFLGNSMPIRNWEFLNTEYFHSVGQRGVNGIDGSLALALGQLDANCENWIILGDITTLYNLNDFQVLSKLEDYKVRIVIVNNSGGRIFEKIFKENKEYLINEQNVSFGRVAALWGVDYAATGSEIEKSNHIICELVVDPVNSAKFWTEFEGLRF